MNSTKKLEQKLREASTAYYYGEPILSDLEFDALKEELRQQAPEHPFLTEIGAPISVIKGQKEKHTMPMGSLRKAATWEEFLSWAKGISSFMVMDKFDGLSCELVYKQGQLVSALTRGDGLTGEVVTDNVRRMKNVAQRLPQQVDITLRGEILLDKNIFAKKYAFKYANPRNTAVGIARRHTGEGCEDLEIQYFAAQTIVRKHYRSELFDWLENYLQVQTPYHRFCQSPEGVKEFLSQETAMRGDLRYETDGIVVLVDKFSERAMGDPMWPSDAIAIKFSADTSRSTVTDIIWEVGRTGRVNPTILVKPVLVSGVTIQRATGNNYGWMKNKNIGIGAEVLISRRGDVIPAVEEVIKQGQPLVAPKACPACGTTLADEGTYLMCLSPSCPEKGLGLMRQWLEMADIKGLGTAGINVLVRAGINMPHKLYDTTIEEYQQLLGANGSKIFKELAHKTTMPLENIFAAFISNVGTRRFQQIQRGGFDTPEKLFALTIPEIVVLNGFDLILAQRIAEGIAANKELIRLVLKHVEVKKVEKISSSGKLVGYGIKFTGKMEYDRNTMEGRAQEAGATIGWNSSLKNILVIADLSSNSTKAKMARSKNYELWTPEQFLENLK